MDTAEIRRRFLTHFERHDHTPVPSASLVHHDPNLLFVNAGMVQFVPYFTGQQTPPYPRAVSVQKCCRTLDIEEVGRTTRHGTFFQMCGNFSFGDYFKQRAIQLAWELVTAAQADGGYGMDESRLYASVYVDDHEAIELWKRVAGLPDDRIVRLGKKDNYWHMGVPGPGGPCSEILIDRGPEFGAERDWEAGDRYLEFWNLVFMQEELTEVRSKADFDVAGPLPRQNIDTGLGLERVGYLLQGVDNMYEIDEVFPVIAKAAELSGRRYGANHDDDVRFRVVADHVRSAMMLIADGVKPGNEARGYVVRRLLRRVVRSMRLLGVEDPTLAELFPVSRDRMRASYPQLATDWARISAIASAEEEAFADTLRAGTTIFTGAVTKVREAGGDRLSGATAFRLHDTFGFPIDLTLEMAAEQGLSVEADEFQRLMAEQRDRAKADARSKKTAHADLAVYRGIADELGAPVRFTGYDEVTSNTSVRALLSDGEPVGSAVEGARIQVVLDATPFYAEAGGQLPDHGTIELDGGAVLDVTDVQAPIDGLVVHTATVRSGSLRAGEQATARIEVDRRRAISRAHSGTHILHQALREALGETATQAGSENAPGRLRFDFSAGAAVKPDELAAIEERINDVVQADESVEAVSMPLAEALASGAMALFGQKYPDVVRVVSIGGEWSRELCGGTHALRSGQLGIVKLLGESSIGSGVRRVEALVGADAHAFLTREHTLVSGLADLLKTQPDQLHDRVSDLVGRLRAAEREIERFRATAVLAAAAELAAGARDVFGVHFVGSALTEEIDAGDLRELTLDVRRRLPADRPGVVVLVASSGGKPGIVVALNELARQWGLRADQLVGPAAEALGGRGGGRDDLAQGGGSDPAEALAALSRVEHAVGEHVTR